MDFHITPEIARIHAHICGDGSIYISRYKRNHRVRNDWTILYYNSCPELISEFIDDFKIAFNRKSQYRKKYIEVRVSGTKHIIQNLEIPFKSSYNWFIPDFIFNAKDSIVVNWIRAYFDDEACVSKDRYEIKVSSINIFGLNQICRLLSRLEIKSKIRGPYKNKNSNNSFWVLVIPKEFLKIYDNKIGFLHPEKIVRMEEKLVRLA